MENWDDDDEDYNIGANEADQLSCNRHEAAAFDYTSVDSNTDSSEKAKDTHCTNYQNGFAGIQSIVNGQAKEMAVNPPLALLQRIGGGESFQKCFMTEEQLKAKQKLEKKKAKRAAGWTKSNDIEGHVEFKEMNKLLLDFVGVGQGEETQSSLSAQQQKKKLRKKLSTACRQKNGTDQYPSVNGRCSSLASHSTSSDSETESKDTPNGNIEITKNYISDSAIPSMTGTTNPKSTNVSVGATKKKSQNTFSIFSGNGEFDMHSHSDGEFKEVHRKKKINHKHSMDKTKAATGVYNNRPLEHRVPARSQRPNGIVKHTEGPSSTKQKIAVVSVLTETKVDLSLSSFPVLESQNIVDRKSPTGEISSVTDDDRDSVASQPMTNSWAKIAAKPTLVKAPVSSVKVNPTSQTRLNEESAVKDTLAKETIDPKCDSVGDCSNNQNLADKADQCADQSTDQSAYQAIPVSDMMTSSTSYVSIIEFGTVTCSADVKSDQHVQSILSNSNCEEQILYNIGNQSRNSKLMKGLSANSPCKGTKVRSSKLKGVVFFDKYSEQNSQQPRLNISFGFDNNETVAQMDSHSHSGEFTTISDQSSSLSSYENVKSEYNDIESTVMSSSTHTDEESTVMSSSMHTDEEFGTPINNSSNPSLPQPVDILPAILAAASSTPQTNSTKQPDSKQHSSSKDSGQFDILSTVKMLQKDWEEVTKLRKQFGSRRVTCSHELLRPN